MTNLVVLEGGILVNPVRVEHPHVGELRAHPLLGHRPQVTHGLDLVDTVVLGLTCRFTKNETVSYNVIRPQTQRTKTHDTVGLSFPSLPIQCWINSKKRDKIYIKRGT